MRLLFKIVVPLAVVVALALGLLPPLFDQGQLDSWTLAAARAASTMNPGSAGGSGPNSCPAAIEAVVEASVTAHRGVTMTGCSLSPTDEGAQVTVSTAETVHTYMDGLPDLKSWFHLTSSQQSVQGE